MSFSTRETAAMLTAAVLSQHRIPMTVDGAEKVALFHKHMVFFLDLHLAEAAAEAATEAAAPERSAGRTGRGR
jgi:hypothetical protein